MQRRLQKLPPAERKPELLPEDFGEDPRKGGAGGEEDIFAGLVGVDNIIEKLGEYRAVIQLAQKRGDDPRDKVSFNFLFVGSPGADGGWQSGVLARGWATEHALCGPLAPVAQSAQNWDE